VTSRRTPADISFQEYGEEVDFDLDFEPDWEKELGGSYSTNPDFLERSCPAIFEVSCRPNPARIYKEDSDRTGEFISRERHKQLFYKLKKKAKQLKEFGRTDLPLIIVLSDPHEALDRGITYYDLAGYRLGSGPAVPAEWFTGPLDRRFCFADDGLTFCRAGSRPDIS
jgi:hypothetical protein